MKNPNQNEVRQLPPSFFQALFPSPRPEIDWNSQEIENLNSSKTGPFLVALIKKDANIFRGKGVPLEPSTL